MWGKKALKFKQKGAKQSPNTKGSVGDTIGDTNGRDPLSSGDTVF